MPHKSFSWIGIACVVCATAAPARAADVERAIPHGQTRAPNAARSAEEAVRHMRVPEGFSVEIVAAEPDIVNPVAMTFDERGRIWITESFEYPRKEAGVGRDRVKILEDTDGDGRADKFTIFAEGLNIPSGIAVGHGGVWVANAPDILFLRDTDGDDRADEREVVVTGFGRNDTHELPNSLTWGPDGWLYGWNGVFNHSHVKHRGREHTFNCAIFRIHPRTRDFELFCEGTSNPWGIAWDTVGSAFASACVIDHLWHLVESGYYHRQGGPYPPFTWKIESIVEHEHQLAAYCGIHWFDSEAYPAEYREKLYMGNIHGNCVNCDSIARRGATYRGSPEPDFLSANDAWFMPVSQKTGPDGCLYVLDWYDRYHCYQDANRDPAGIDRLKGRLYRVRYQDTPRAAPFDLASETDERLIARLSSGNVYYRDLAQRLLAERADGGTRAKLGALVLDESANRKARMHALWSLVSQGPLEAALHAALLRHEDVDLRAWAVRAAGNQREVDDSVRSLVERSAADPAPEVRLQATIASRKLSGVDALGMLLIAMRGSADDPMLPRVIWQNLHPLLDERSDDFVASLASLDGETRSAVLSLAPRALDRMLASERVAIPTVAKLLDQVAGLSTQDETTLDPARDCFTLLATKFANGELPPPRAKALAAALAPWWQAIHDRGSDHPLLFEGAMVALAGWHEPTAIDRVRDAFASAKTSDRRRLDALAALVAAGDDKLLDEASALLADARENSIELRRGVVEGLARMSDPRVAEHVLTAYPAMEPELRPQAIELLTQRSGWSQVLLAAIARGEIDRAALNTNQVSRMAGMSAELAEQTTRIWGAIRTERNTAREEVIARMRDHVRQNPGDAIAGRQVFNKLCGQCHKIHGQGEEVGPDITRNGRGSFDQLLSNVFDPSLVIGADYQARLVATTDGRVLTGLLAEDSPARIVLKVQGGKLEVVPRDQIDVMEVSKLSMMPESIETQLTPREISDLFAFITLDGPPEDANSKQLPGVRLPAARSTQDTAEMPGMAAEVLRGFATSASGEGGLAIVAEHMGRLGVLRTHPIDPTHPCVLSGSFAVPSLGKPKLRLVVSSDPLGDWQLVVKVEDEMLHQSTISAVSAESPWRTVEVDLSKFAGRTIRLDLWNRATGWNHEFGYWAAADVVSE